MNHTSASAPGKLFLLGEYAVLEGGPALLAPVPQRARVEARACAEAEHGAVAEVITDATKTVPFANARRDIPILDSVLCELTDATALRTRFDEGRVSLHLDTSAFFRDGRKLGLGSSAALTVALTKLFAESDTAQHNIAAIATKAHRHLQGGVGSGADVALAAMDAPTLFRGEPTPASIPPDLHALGIWTGEAASTTTYIASLREYEKRKPKQYRQRMSALVELAEQGASATNAAEFTQVAAAFDQALAALSKESALNFYTSEHQALRKQVELAGCTYKLSGAGGGDFGIAFTSDESRIQALQDAMHREGRLTVRPLLR